MLAENHSCLHQEFERKQLVLNIANIKALSGCHFLCRQSPSAAEEVKGRTALRLNSRVNTDSLCLKITARETIHHNYPVIVIVALCDPDM